MSNYSRRWRGLAWEPTRLCGGHHRGVFGRMYSSGFGTDLVGMALVLVANAICVSSLMLTPTKWSPITLRESVFVI